MDKEEYVVEDGFRLLTMENGDGTHIRDLILNTIEEYPEIFGLTMKLDDNHSFELSQLVEICEEDDIHKYNKETMREFIRRKYNGKQGNR